jgi:hypothetical protein
MEQEPILTGYATKTEDSTYVKIALNSNVLKHCITETSSTGEEYINLRINLNRLLKVMVGTRTVTTVTTPYPKMLADLVKEEE